MTVYDFANRHGLWHRIEQAVAVLVPDGQTFLERIRSVPVKASKATRSLGCYYSRGSEPRCIRLQFVQEPDALRQTFLHEVAHLCDHLLTFQGKMYRGGHGKNWQHWAKSFKISSERCGHSPAVAKLHQERLKVVAVCERCQQPIYRQRRLPSRRQYLHAGCGGRLRPV
nr:SprT-like domain-containing protein [uncultured Desulfuromonas sp.]